MNLQKELSHFAKSHSEIEKLELFGSAARGETTPASDIDLLVTFSRDAEITLFDLGALKEDLEAAIKRPVDLLTRRSVEQSRNPLRRDRILNEAITVYGR